MEYLLSYEAPVVTADFPGPPSSWDRGLPARGHAQQNGKAPDDCTSLEMRRTAAVVPMAWTRYNQDRRLIEVPV